MRAKRGTPVVWEWVILPSVGGLIGWATNIVAVRMLFRPKRPLRVKQWHVYQGVLPRRQKELARVIGETVKRDLLPMEEVLENLHIDRYQDEAVEAVARHVQRRVENNLPEVLPASLRQMLGSYMHRAAMREVAAIVENLTQQLKERVQEDIDLGALVEEKVNQFDTDELEKLVLRIAGKELRVVEGLGAVLGMIIGVLQAFFLTVLG